MEIRIETLKTGYLVTESDPIHSPNRVGAQHACATVVEVHDVIEKILAPPPPNPPKDSPRFERD